MIEALDPIPALLAISLALLGCRTPDDRGGLAATDLAAPASELGGLRATVSPLLANEAALGPIEVTYELEWTAQPGGWIDSSVTICVANIWLLRPLEPAVVRYWNAAGTLVDEGGQQILLPDEFRARGTSKHKAPVRIAPPADATSLSIALGRSGLETARIPVPAPRLLLVQVEWLRSPPK